MKNATLLLVSLMLMNFAFGQQSNFADKHKPYNPEANARQEVADAIEKAKNEGKFVLLQVGGNWCPWCLKFHKYAANTASIKGSIDSNYVYSLVNYSRENKNESLLKELGNPGRFGYPVFVVLNDDGKVIHIQDSGYLENGKGGYDDEKVLRFLKLWSPNAIK